MSMAAEYVNRFNDYATSYASNVFPPGCEDVAGFIEVWGHEESYAVIAKNEYGYWVGTGGGCSCGGGTSVDGPFSVLTDAVKHIPTRDVAELEWVGDGYVCGYRKE